MKKLEKQLKKLSNNLIESKTTLSKYYTINNVIIRISDHLTVDAHADLLIIVPSNNVVDKYIVTFKDCMKFYLWNTDQILDYIPYLDKYLNLTTKTLKVTSESSEFKIVKTTLVADKLTKDERKVWSAGNSKVWTSSDIMDLENVLRRDLLKPVVLSEEFKEFLYKHTMKYTRVLNLYVYTSTYPDTSLEEAFKEICDKTK